MAVCRWWASETRVISRTTRALALNSTMAMESVGRKVHQGVQRVLHEVQPARSLTQAPWPSRYTGVAVVTDPCTKRDLNRPA